MTRAFKLEITDGLPGILNFDQSVLSNEQEVLHYVAVATNQTLVVIEAGCGDEVLPVDGVCQLKPELVDGLAVDLILLGRLASQKLGSFRLSAARNHLVVDVGFGIRLLKQREPPALVGSLLGKRWSVGVSREYVVYTDVFGSTFHKASDGEDALFVVLLLMEQLSDEIASIC